jgi:hypothetical protein
MQKMVIVDPLVKTVLSCNKHALRWRADIFTRMEKQTGKVSNTTNALFIDEKSSRPFSTVRW